MSTKMAVTPDNIMQLGFGFTGSKTLLSAIELELFTELAKGALNAEQLRDRLKLHPRSVRDFFDAFLGIAVDELDKPVRHPAETPVVPLPKVTAPASTAAMSILFAATYPEKTDALNKANSNTRDPGKKKGGKKKKKKRT